MKTTVGRLRWVGFFEAISYLLLLGVAMPLKYVANWPLGVEVVGWVHGALFIAFCAALAMAHFRYHWGWQWTLTCFVAALLPLGPFFMDRRLARFEQ